MRCMEAGYKPKALKSSLSEGLQAHDEIKQGQSDVLPRKDFFSYFAQTLAFMRILSSLLARKPARAPKIGSGLGTAGVVGPGEDPSRVK